MQRFDIINQLIELCKFTSYLEIGTRSGDCFKQIRCASKECVDIEKNYAELTYHMSSDDFFKQNTKTYDIIFIDGNHEEEFVFRDIENSLKILNLGGYIVCHDCLPTKAEHLLPNSYIYTGTVYSAVINIQRKYPELDVKVIDTDFGVGLITRRIANPTYQKIPFDVFDTERSSFFHIVSIK